MYAGTLNRHRRSHRQISAALRRWLSRNFPRKMPARTGRARKSANPWRIASSSRAITRANEACRLGSVSSLFSAVLFLLSICSSSSSFTAGLIFNWRNSLRSSASTVSPACKLFSSRATLESVHYNAMRSITRFRVRALLLFRIFASFAVVMQRQGQCPLRSSIFTFHKKHNSCSAESARESGRMRA